MGKYLAIMLLMLLPPPTTECTNSSIILITVSTDQLNYFHVMRVCPTDYGQQWPPGYGSSPQQSSVGTAAYTSQDGHAMYSTQTAGAEGYGGQNQGYSYDNPAVVPSQTPTAAASYPQQSYGDTSAK